MEKLRQLQEGLDAAEEKLSEAKGDLMHYLTPIVKKLHGIERLPGDFHRLNGPYGPDKEYELELRWEGSGGPYDYTYRIPRAVFEAADAEAAAAELARTKAREAERERKAGIRAEIARLQSQL